MATFADLKNLVYASIARDATDPTAALIVPKAINYAINAIAALLKPVELYEAEATTITAGNSSLQYTTKFIDIIDIYNVTDSAQILFVPYETFRLVIPTMTTIRYFSTFGSTLWFNAEAAVDTAIRIGLIGYPDELVNDSDELEFSQHETVVVSAATMICWAVFEEGDSMELWSRIANTFGLSLAKAAQAREVVAGRPTFIESTTTGALAGG